MAGNETQFVDKVTIIQAAWANDVDHLVFSLLGDGSNAPSTAAQVRTALGIGNAGLTTGTAADLAYNPGPQSGIPSIDITVQSALDYLGQILLATTATANSAVQKAGSTMTGPLGLKAAASDGSDAPLQYQSKLGGNTYTNTARLNPTTLALEWQNTAGAVIAAMSDAGVFSALQLTASGTLTVNAGASSYGHRYMSRAGVALVDEYLDTGNNWGINAVNGGAPNNIFTATQAGLLTFGQRPKVGANLIWDAGNLVPSQYAALASSPNFTGVVSAAGTQLSGKGYSIDGAQLLANSTGELGAIGWSGSWLPYNDINGAYFGYPGTGTAQSGTYIGPKATVAASSPIVVQLEAATSAITAGTLALQLTYLNAAGATISTASIPVTNGSAWKYYWTAFTTPALCTAVMVSIVLTGATVGTGSVPAVRRIKVEYGTQPSTYSQEATAASGLLNNTVQFGGASSAARLTGDFSNANYAQRAQFQTMTANSQTLVGAIPTGSGIGSAWLAHAQADPSNSSRLSWGFAADGSSYINSDSTGSGTTKPMNFQMAGATVARLLTDGALMVGPSSLVDDTTSLLQVAGAIRSSTGGYVFPDGTVQTTANGVTAPTSYLFSVADGTLTNGQTLINITGGYIAPFIDGFRNGGRMTNGVDFTYAGDGHGIVLKNGASNIDRYEFLARQVYSPSTAVVPASNFFTPAAGSSFILCNHTPGFSRTYIMGVRQVPGVDVDDSNPAQITFLGMNANGIDTYEVEVLQPITLANMVPLTGGAISGLLSVAQMLTATSGVTFGDASVQKVAGYTPNRNLLDNAAFMIDQTGSGTTSTTTNSYWYGADRWSMTNSGAGLAMTVNGAWSGGAVLGYNGQTYPALFHIVTTVASNYGGSACYAGVAQTIESYRLYGKQGQPMVASFLFVANNTGTFTFSLRTGQSPALSYVTTFNAVANVPQRVVIPIPAIPSNANFPLNSLPGLYWSIGGLNGSTYLAPTSSSWQSGGYFVATGANQWTQTVGNQIGIAQPQLEFGTVATAFENREVEAEWRQAQRFYTTTICTRFSSTTVVGAEDRTSYTFPGPMRAIPSMLLLSPGVSSNATLQAPVVYDARGFGFRFTANAAGTFAIDSSVYGADARI